MSDIALQAIGEMLIQAFEDTVEQPLPPLILQLMLQLHEMTGGDEDDAPETCPQPKKADLFLPDIGLLDRRHDG
jgi:hypothetical protein